MSSAPPQSTPCNGNISFFFSFFATIWKTTGWDAYHKSMFVCGVNRKSEWVRKRVWEELHPLMRRWWCFRLFISFIATVLQAFGVTDWQREVKQSVSDVLADVGVNSEITQPSCHFAWSQWELSNIFFIFFLSRVAVSHSNCYSITANHNSLMYHVFWGVGVMWPSDLPFIFYVWQCLKVFTLFFPPSTAHPLIMAAFLWNNDGDRWLIPAGGDKLFSMRTTPRCRAVRRGQSHWEMLSSAINVAALRCVQRR